MADSCRTASGEHAADTDDGTCDAADCSLREAINAANAAGRLRRRSPSRSPAAGPQIGRSRRCRQLTTPPSHRRHDGAARRPGRWASFSTASAAALPTGSCSRPAPDGSTIRGLAIRDFARQTRPASASSRTTTTSSGTTSAPTPAGTPAPSQLEGILVQGGDGNTIGGSAAADRNVISANDERRRPHRRNGERSGRQHRHRELHRPRRDGLSAIGNAGPGVWVLEATNTLVGGPTPATGTSSRTTSTTSSSATSTRPRAATTRPFATTRSASPPTAPSRSRTRATASRSWTPARTRSRPTRSPATYQGIDICGPSNNTVVVEHDRHERVARARLRRLQPGHLHLRRRLSQRRRIDGPGEEQPHRRELRRQLALNGIAVDSIQNTVLGNTVTNTKDGAAIETHELREHDRPGNTVAQQLARRRPGQRRRRRTRSGRTRSTRTAARASPSTAAGTHGQSFPVLASAALILNGSVRIQGTLTSNAGHGLHDRVLRLAVVRPVRVWGGRTSSASRAAGRRRRRRHDRHRLGPLRSRRARRGGHRDRDGLDFAESTSEFSACVTATDLAQSSPFVVNTNADHDDGTLHGARLHAARGDQRRERGAGQRRSTSTSRPARRRSARPRTCRRSTRATTIDATTQPGYRRDAARDPRRRQRRAAASPPASSSRATAARFAAS